MKKTIQCAAALFVLAAMFSLKSAAQTTSGTDIPVRHSDVPRILSYQGQITSTDGIAMNGTHHITATLYSDHLGKNSVWQGSYNAAVTNGVFTVMLGSGVSKLPDNTTLDRPLWVGINVDGSDEMRPLTQLSAAPYALNVPDKSITQAKLADEVLQSIVNRSNGHIPTVQAVPDRIALSDAGGTTFGAGTLGSTTTVLHGNVAGASPSYSAVNLTADVSGILPAANGGTGSSAGSWILGGNTLGVSNWLGSIDNYAAEIHVNRDRERPLLRDGSRQALGAGGESI